MEYIKVYKTTSGNPFDEDDTYLIEVDTTGAAKLIAAIEQAMKTGDSEVEAKDVTIHFSVLDDATK